MKALLCAILLSSTLCSMAIADSSRSDVGRLLHGDVSHFDFGLLRLERYLNGLGFDEVNVYGVNGDAVRIDYSVFEKRITCAEGVNKIRGMLALPDGSDERIYDILGRLFTPSSASNKERRTAGKYIAMNTEISFFNLANGRVSVGCASDLMEGQ